MRFDAAPFGRPETLENDAVIATYIAHGLDHATVLNRAGAFAVGQTVGTWVPVPGLSQTMVENYQGRVLGVCDAGLTAEAEERCFVLRVAFPAANFGRSLSALLTALLGNDVSTAMRARLVDLEFSPGALRPFLGPAQGIEDLRRLTGVRGRPLVLNMIKPCAGFSPGEGAALFAEVARGGVDMIKDDELLASPGYNEVAQRFKAYSAAARAVFEETCHRPLYLPNLSGTPAQMMENAKALLAEGAKACLVNFVFGGIDALLELCDAFGKELFIMGHYAGAGVFSSWDCGLANPVSIGLLPRLAGAHAVMTMAPTRTNAHALFDFEQTVQAQRLPLPGIAPLVTAVGGGLTPVSQAAYQHLLGPDTILGIGGAIQGHPLGTAAGAQAAMRAVKATAQGMPLGEAAQDCPPLAKALELWGEKTP